MKKNQREKQQRLFVWSWPYRVRRLCRALGWTLTKLAAVSGITFYRLQRIANWRGPARKQPRLHINTIRKILNMERIYAIHIKRYTHWPTKWDRSPGANKYLQGPFKLYPVRVQGRPEDIKKVDLLATYSPDEAKDEWGRNKRDRDYLRRGRKTASTWRKRLASGWDWHEARKKNAAGRPYYNMGRKEAMDRGIPPETAPNRLNYKSPKRRNDNGEEES